MDDSPTENYDLDGSLVYLVINENIEIGADRTFIIDYQGRSTIITVANPERALTLLPNVAVDAIVHARGPGPDIALELIKAYTRETLPNTLIIDARRYGMSLDKWNANTIHAQRANASGANRSETKGAYARGSGSTQCTIDGSPEVPD